MERGSIRLMNKKSQIPSWLNESLFSISVLLPTRGRTDALKTSVMSLIDLADDPTSIQIMLGFDDDDNDSQNWAVENIIPIIEAAGSRVNIFRFNRLGYLRLNEYVNTLAHNSSADWLMFWNDDAVMKTQGWDQEIRKFDGKFRVLRMPTHNEHPYAIFPIVPKEWYRLLGYLCPHQISDAWISQTAFMLDIMTTIPVDVLHDRHDLTGNNGDETYEKRIMLEGNHEDPRDFNHVTWRQRRFQDANKIAWYLDITGRDTTWFRAVCEGSQDPWEKMLSPEYDPNNQVKIVK